MLFRYHVRYKDLMLGDKMPDSPDTLAKVPVSIPSGIPITLSSCKTNLTQVTNGTHSPRPPNSSPSPPTNNSHSTNSMTSPVSSRIDLATNLTKTRDVVKVKRFLATLQQYASDRSSETGEQVRVLILGLVSASVSIEEFHHKIQEIINYPLKPFAIPFLKSHLPLLQSEIIQYSRIAKQSLQQYVMRHPDHFLLDATSHTTTEPFEIFQAEVKENGKRKSPIIRQTRAPSEYEDTNGDCLHPPKRHQTMPSPNIAQKTSPAAPSSHSPSELSLRMDDTHFYRDRDSRYDRFDRLDRDFYRPFYSGMSRDYSEERGVEEEWRNIHTMLNCILGMVEKTKRALAILQHRSNTERTEISSWARVDLKKSRPPDIVSHYKAAEDRVTEVRRRAEDAVNEVKRQAVAELQKAVSAAETKANELVSTERLKMERLLSDARRQAAEDALATVSHQEESTENCWNCGRKANETCSGCNKARYCGSFCQHKDWETHHRSCNQTPSPSNNGSPSVENSHSPIDVKHIKTDPA